jgi:hypothetical protein
MSLYTIEIAGRPIMVFAAQDRMEADAFAKADHLRGDLLVLEHEGRPLWNGQSELFVRETHPEEAARWEIAFAEMRQAGEASEPEDCATFLVEVRDPTDKP